MSYQQLQDRIGHLLYGEGWLTLPVPKAVAKAGALVKDAVSSWPAPLKLFHRL